MKPTGEYEKIRRALLLRRPDDQEFTTAAHFALAALERLERKDLAVQVERTTEAMKRAIATFRRLDSRT